MKISGVNMLWVSKYAKNKPDIPPNKTAGRVPSIPPAINIGIADKTIKYWIGGFSIAIGWAISGKTPIKGVNTRIKTDKDANQINFSFENPGFRREIRIVMNSTIPNQTNQAIIT